MSDGPQSELEMRRALSAAFHDALVALGAARRPVLVAAIGTDRSTGDALGPLTGEAMLRLGAPDLSVLGRLADPLHAGNLSRVAARVAAEPDLLVIAVDAALGPRSLVGSIRLRNGGIAPGRGVGKSLVPIGELAVSAVVGTAGGEDAQAALQSVRLYVVNSLAELIAGALWSAIVSVRRPERNGRFASGRLRGGRREPHDAHDVAHREHTQKLAVIEHNDMAHAVFHHQGGGLLD